MSNHWTYSMKWRMTVDRGETGSEWHSILRWQKANTDKLSEVTIKWTSLEHNKKLKLAPCHPSVMRPAGMRSDVIGCGTAALHVSSHFCMCFSNVLFKEQVRLNTHRWTVLPFLCDAAQWQYDVQTKPLFSLNRKTSHLIENLSLKRFLKP